MEQMACKVTVSPDDVYLTPNTFGKTLASKYVEIFLFYMGDQDVTNRVFTFIQTCFETAKCMRTLTEKTSYFYTLVEKDMIDRMHKLDLDELLQSLLCSVIHSKFKIGAVADKHKNKVIPVPRFKTLLVKNNRHDLIEKWFPAN
jgi:hypothetical protein